MDIRVHTEGTLVDMIVLHKAQEDLVIHYMKARKGGPSHHGGRYRHGKAGEEGGHSEGQEPVATSIRSRSR